MDSRQFWSWFFENKELFEKLDEIEQDTLEKRLNLLGDKLSSYCDGLAYEMGGDEGDWELVISADGDLALFGHVIKLVDDAPDIPGWKITAFRQPHEKVDQIGSIGLKGLKLNPDTMTFVLMRRDDDPTKLGLCIAVPNFDEDRLEDFLFGIWILLDHHLGEFLAGTEIHHIELVSKTLEEAQKDFMPLNELRDFLNQDRKGRKQDA